MQITEQDIFNFVFFPDLISDDKSGLIKNSEKYKTEVEFYRSLKELLATDVDPGIKSKLAERVEAYKPVNIFYLYPAKENFKKNHSGRLVFAAASPDDKPKISSRTYYDKSMTYIIKVLNYDGKSKIFVFSPQFELIEDFTLIISPQNLTYHVTNNTAPLELDFNVEPESISLEFNLTKRT